MTQISRRCTAYRGKCLAVGPGRVQVWVRGWVQVWVQGAGPSSPEPGLSSTRLFPGRIQRTRGYPGIPRYGGTRFHTKPTNNKGLPFPWFQPLRPSLSSASQDESTTSHTVRHTRSCLVPTGCQGFTENEAGMSTRGYEEWVQSRCKAEISVGPC